MKIILKFISSLFIIFNISAIETEKPFVIIIPSYNNEEWYSWNLASVFSQNYSNYRVIYIDDRSEDRTYKCVKNYIKKTRNQKRVSLIRNKKRQGALANFYKAIQSCRPEEIIVCLDGDDWLAHEDALSRLNRIYNKENVWLTYGQCVNWPQDDFFRCQALPKEVICAKSYRKHPWVTSHLKTFYAWLFQQINIEDLFYKNDFYEMCSDLAMMFPMLEMAGSHSRFIDEILYVYNICNVNNDFKKNPFLQIHLEEVIRNRHCYDTLKSFVIVIPSYNNSRWCIYNLNSVFSQTYPVYRVVYIDDNSTDDTFIKVKKYLNEIDTYHDIFLKKNDERIGALANHYEAIKRCKDNEIIVSLDGDDWFSDEFVLKYLNKIYQDPNIWLTYGQFCNWPTGEIGWCENYPEKVIKKNEFREFGFVAAQPRTYYGWLAKQIKIEDLFDDKGTFYSVAGDVALMFPMLEMAGERFKYIPEILTQRNVATELNDFKMQPDLQLHTTACISKKNKYKRMEGKNTLHS